MFHAKNGLFFGRLPDGAVRILIRDPSRTDPLLDTNLSAATWASVIAAVSKAGETADKFQIARDFHG